MYRRLYSTIPLVLCLAGFLTSCASTETTQTSTRTTTTAQRGSGITPHQTGTNL